MSSAAAVTAKDQAAALAQLDAALDGGRLRIAAMKDALAANDAEADKELAEKFPDAPTAVEKAKSSVIIPDPPDGDVCP